MGRRLVPVDGGGGFLQIIVAEGRPVAIWCLVGGHRQGGFLLVEERFHEHVVGARLAIEHQLYVTRHKKQFVTAPMFVECFQIAAVVGVAEFEQTSQWE